MVCNKYQFVKIFCTHRNDVTRRIIGLCFFEFTLDPRARTRENLFVDRSLKMRLSRLLYRQVSSETQYTRKCVPAFQWPWLRYARQASIIDIGSLFDFRRFQRTVFGYKRSRFGYNPDSTRCLKSSGSWMFTGLSSICSIAIRWIVEDDKGLLLSTWKMKLLYIFISYVIYKQLIYICKL